MNNHIGSDFDDWLPEQDFLDLLSRDIEDGNIQPIQQDLFERFEKIKALAQKNIEEEQNASKSD
jgi:hypothetical protein